MKSKLFRYCKLLLCIVCSLLLVSCQSIPEKTTINQRAESELQTSETQTDNPLSTETPTTIQATDSTTTQQTVDSTATEQATDSTDTESLDATDFPTSTETSAPESTLATPSTCGALSVNGTQLVDCNGNPIQLKGISTHGLSWFPDYVNESCFRGLRQNWNANVIRLALYTAEYNGYCTGGDKEALKDLIHNGVEYAKNQDMYVIIDWHVLNDQTPMLYKEDAKQFFAEMSSEFATYDHVLYEICNEPNGGTSWSDIKSYAEEVIEIIRSNDSDAIIIVGTPNWSQYVDQAAADPITDYDNIMYALHFYAATHGDSLRNTMVAAIEADLPIFVSEYGICDASGNGAIDYASSEKWLETMDTYGISYVAWNLSNKAESSAILNNSCTKTSGFTEDDLSEGGKWIFEMLTKTPL